MGAMNKCILKTVLEGKSPKSWSLSSALRAGGHVLCWVITGELLAEVRPEDSHADPRGGWSQAWLLGAEDSDVCRLGRALPGVTNGHPCSPALDLPGCVPAGLARLGHPNQRKPSAGPTCQEVPAWGAGPPHPWGRLAPPGPEAAGLLGPVCGEPVWGPVVPRGRARAWSPRPPAATKRPPEGAVRCL